MKFLIPILLIFSLSASAIEINKKDSHTDFNAKKNIYDNGCLNMVAGIDNRNVKILKDFYHTILLDIWFNNHEMKKFAKPTKKTVQRSLTQICNFAMSKEKSFTFITYQKAMKLKMSHEKYFKIEQNVLRKYSK